MRTVRLYRPVGLKELALVKESGWRRFPPRLEWQPIFYPVLNAEYAAQIAKDWNTRDEFSGYCGIVLGFSVAADYYSGFAVQNVGGVIHNELWVPAEQLAVFNDHIEGAIEVLEIFVGDAFVMPEDVELSGVLKRFLL